MVYGESNKLFCISKIAVFEDYEFVGNNFYDGKFKAKGDIKYYYNPLEDVDILSKIANLNDYTEDFSVTVNILLKFFREFGLLGNVEKQEFDLVRFWHSQPHTLAFHEQNFSDINDSLIGLQETILTVNGIVASDEVISESDNRYIELLNSIHNNYEKHRPDYIIFDNTEVKKSSPKKEYISALIRSRSAMIESVQVLEDEYVPSISFTSLLDVAYFQLINALYEQKTFSKCKNCGLIFLAKHRNQRFCAPLPNRKRSTCENTFNQRKKRLKKQQEKSNK